MCRKVVQKVHSVKRDKGGFTLAELVIVLALMAILTTMFISFSVLMSGFTTEHKAEYEFLEEHAALKEVFSAWVAENDTPGSVFLVAEDGTLTVTVSGTEKIVKFADGVLFLDEAQKDGYDAIDGVTFSANEKLIKCVTHRVGKNGKQTERSFVLFLRSGTITEVAPHA